MQFMNYSFDFMKRFIPSTILSYFCNRLRFYNITTSTYVLKISIPTLNRNLTLYAYTLNLFIIILNRTRHRNPEKYNVMGVENVNPKVKYSVNCYLNKKKLIQNKAS